MTNKFKNVLGNNRLLFTVLVITLAIVFYGINKPFIGHHDWNGVWIATIARNHLRYGLTGTRLGQSLNAGVYKPSELGFQTHHPLLLPLLTATSFAIFDEKDWSARLIPAIASVIMIIFLFMIGKELFDQNVAVLASLFAVFTPIFIYFSKLPVHETVVPAFILIAFYSYIRWYKTHKKNYFIFLALFVIISQLTGWAGYYMAGYMAMHTFIFNHKKGKIIFWLIPLSLIMFCAHLLHTKILTGAFFGGGLVGVFLFRSNPSMTASIYGYSMEKFIVQELRFIIIFFTRILSIASVIWLVIIMKNYLTRHRVHLIRDSFVVTLLFFGLTHMLLFRNLSFIHDYMIYYLLPFITLSAAIVISSVLKKIPSPILSSIVMVIIVGAVFLERLSLVKALMDTHDGERAQQIGFLMKQKTKADETVLITSNQYRQFWDVFIAYYGDRRVSYAESLPNNWKNDFQLIIRPKDHDALDYNNKEYLDNHFSRQENDRFIWYDLHSNK